MRRSTSAGLSSTLAAREGLEPPTLALGKPCSIRLSYRAARGFQIVEGKVTTVRRDGRGFALDVQGLSAAIPAYAVRDFEAAGKAPADLAGRLVRLRGAIRRGPSMRLDHPEMVELLEG